MVNGGGDTVVIFRMQHAPEGIAGQLFEILQVVTSEDVDNGFVDIKQFLFTFCLIDEESAGHLAAELFHDRQRFFVQKEFFSEHIGVLRVRAG